MKYSKLLVLDLDETLLYTVEQKEREPSWEPHWQSLDGCRTYLRPSIHHFLEGVLARFEAVGVWTAGTHDYALEMLRLIATPEQILQLRFIYSRERCHLKRDLETDEYCWIKDIKKLKKFGFHKNQILFIDDTAAGLQKSYGNLIRIPKFVGDPNDNLLQKLLIYLDEIGDTENVRSIQKRIWNTK